MSTLLRSTPCVRPPSAATIDEAAQRIRHGELVALPTETVYGLAGNALDERAVALIFAVKGRPAFNPLIVHVLGLAEARDLAIFSPAAERLANAFWPGPLTLVLERHPTCPVPLLTCAGLSSIAIRAPAHPIARAVLKSAGVPLAAPSANRSGALSPTHAAHVVEDLGDKIALILDGGSCPLGLESTVVDARSQPVRILRPGIITADNVQSVVGEKVMGAGSGVIESPGQSERHYAPKTPLRLGADAARPGEIFIGFGSAAGDFNLSTRGDLTEAAANLYATLHLADAKGAQGIAVAPIPHQGLGIAINDRLRRATGGEP